MQGATLKTVFNNKKAFYHWSIL